MAHRAYQRIAVVVAAALAELVNLDAVPDVIAAMIAAARPGDRVGGLRRALWSVVGRHLLHSLAGSLLTLAPVVHGPMVAAAAMVAELASGLPRIEPAESYTCSHGDHDCPGMWILRDRAERRRRRAM